MKKRLLNIDISQVIAIKVRDISCLVLLFVMLSVVMFFPLACLRSMGFGFFKVGIDSPENVKRTHTVLALPISFEEIVKDDLILYKDAAGKNWLCKIQSIETDDDGNTKLLIEGKGTARYLTADNEGDRRVIAKYAYETPLADFMIEYTHSGFFYISAVAFILFGGVALLIMFYLPDTDNWKAGQKEEVKPEKKKSKFALRLRELRLAKGFSRTLISAYIKVPEKTYTMWEEGDCEPSFDTIIMLTQFFKVSADYLLGIE